MSNLYVAFFAIAFLLFPLGWVSVCGVLASMSGWAKLAKRFRTERPRPAQRRTTGARLGTVSYSGMLVVGWSDEGLHLSVWMPWRFRHPALLIPWQAISRRTSRRTGTETLEIDGESLRLATKVTKAFEPWLPAMEGSASGSGQLGAPSKALGEKR